LCALRLIPRAEKIVGCKIPKVVEHVHAVPREALYGWKRIDRCQEKKRNGMVDDALKLWRTEYMELEIDRL
jgi:hypothetical protein